MPAYRLHTHNGGCDYTDLDDAIRAVLSAYAADPGAYLTRADGSPLSAAEADALDTARCFGAAIGADVEEQCEELYDDVADPPGGCDPSEPEGWDDSTGKE
jgi:hypothetical protein